MTFFSGLTRKASFCTVRFCCMADKAVLKQLTEDFHIPNSDKQYSLRDVYQKIEREQTADQIQII